jgi:hypothetical protein
MHVHLPKPLHGWRELVGEVGIIVIGVLIALGAEQVVEDIHWNAETRAARRALDSDAQDSLASALFRKSEQPCIDRRLNEIATIFREHARGQAVVLHGSIGRPPALFLPTATWQVSVSSQAVVHMSLKERLNFGAAFQNYDNMNDLLRREQEAWLKLAVLDDPTVLSDGDWPGLHEAYAAAKTLSKRMGLIADWVLSDQSLGQAPSKSTAANRALALTVQQFCTPILKG